MAAVFRFVVHVSVGRLVKWLRAMGYDTVFPTDGDDNDLVRIAQGENRVLVSRYGWFGLQRVARQCQLRVVSIGYDDLPGQLRQRVRELKLDLESGSLAACDVTNHYTWRRLLTCAKVTRNLAGVLGTAGFTGRAPTGRR